MSAPAVPWTHKYVLRAVIEFTTPFLIGAGWGDGMADVTFVADAHGWPALPGSSLAGVLRALYQERHGVHAAEALFGFQRRQEGAGSRLAVSWGCLHNANNMPVEGRSCPSDAVLANAQSPTVRDHVRLTCRGAADAENAGKFDEHAVAAGHRFTFELELSGTEEDAVAWGHLMKVLCMPGLRLGGKTRRGFGAFKFVSLASRTFDLRKDFEDYAKHPVALGTSSAVLKKISLPEETSGAQVELSVRPRGFWMFGGGEDSGTKEEADMAPVRDRRVIWTNKNGAVEGSVQEDVLVIPASGVKGALAHRVAFHYNALAGRFADEKSREELQALCGEENPAVRELFGYCKGRRKVSVGGEGEGEEALREAGQRGRVVLDDLYLEREPESQVVHHVGIDRFTGGARDQVLFSERPLWQGDPLTWKISVTGKLAEMDPKIVKAFHLALRDLVEGRLQVGAGSGRGLGYFEGTMKCAPEFEKAMEVCRD